jgi:hypothetical protein
VAQLAYAGTGSFTGSFKGDGANVTGVVSASYATNAGSANNATNATSASVAQLAYAGTGSFTGSFKGDGTNVINVISSSYAVTSSFALNAAGGAGITQGAADARYVFRAGDSLTGSFDISGSVTGSRFKGDGSNITGVISSSYSLNAGSSNNATNATSASVAQLAYAGTGSFTGSFSGQHTGSYTGSFKGDGTNVIGVVSASYAQTASFALFSIASGSGITQGAADARYVIRAGDSLTGSFDISGSVTGSRFKGDGSNITGVISASYATNAASSNTATSASYATNAGSSNSATNATSASVAQLAYAGTGSFTGSFKGDGAGVTGVVSASYALNAGIATTASSSLSASTAQVAYTGTGSFTGSFKGDGTNVINVVSSSYALSSSFALVSTTTNTTSASFATTTTRGVSNFTVTGSLIISGGQSNATAFDNGNSALARTIDWSKSNLQKLTLTGSCTLSFTNAVSGAFYLIQAIQDATGGRQIKWPSSIQWDSDGSTPSGSLGASSTDLYSFYSDVGIFYGSSFAALGPTTASLALYALAGSGSWTGSYTGSFTGGGAGITGVISSSYSTNAGNSVLATSASVAQLAYAGTGSFTGSFKGDGANVTGVVSASYALNAGSSNNATNATSASVAQLAYAGTGSFTGSFSGQATGSYTGSFKGDGTNIINVVSSSYALTASVSLNSAGGGITQGQADARYILRAGDNVTGSFAYTGSISASFFSGSGAAIIGVVSSSYALTSSYALFAIASGSGITQGAADARYVLRVGDTLTGSFDISGSVTGSRFKGDGSNITGVISASYATNAGNSVLATSASVAQLAYVVTGSVSVTGSAILTGSFTGSFKGDGANIINVVSSSYAVTASLAQSLRATRLNLSFTSLPLSVNGATGSVFTSSVQLGSEAFLMIVSSSTISRVRLYNNTSSMSTDISRSIGSDPSASSGVLLDAFFTGSTRILALTPPVWTYNNDLTVNNTIYMTVTNHTASIVPISVQFTYIPI